MEIIVPPGEYKFPIKISECKRYKKLVRIIPMATIQTFEIKIPCGSEKTGREFIAGEVVDRDELKKHFSVAVIDNWLEITPPVLAEFDPDAAVDEEE